MLASNQGANRVITFMILEAMQFKIVDYQRFLWAKKQLVISIKLNPYGRKNLPDAVSQQETS